VSEKRNNSTIAGSLLFVVVMWGGNNVATKWLLAAWPPVWTGATRFLLAGFILLAVLHFTNWLGKYQPLARESWRQLWLRGGLSLAAYIVVFCWALRLAAASHVALYIGTSPIWALLWEERPQRNWSSARRYGAALLAVAGVVVLFWPALKTADTNLAGEFCGLAASLLWANFNHQSRILAARIDGVQIAAHSMWMAGVWLLVPGLVDLAAHGMVFDAPHLGVQVLCVFIGGVIPYAIWNSAFRHWRASRVMIFSNFIPITTTLWAHFILREHISATFCTAMALIVAGVLLGQMEWAKIFKLPEGF
jgi:drug/metabolite transporter (DMT)-like permease